MPGRNEEKFLREDVILLHPTHTSNYIPVNGCILFVGKFIRALLIIQHSRHQFKSCSLPKLIYWVLSKLEQWDEDIGAYNWGSFTYGCVCRLRTCCPVWLKKIVPSSLLSFTWDTYPSWSALNILPKFFSFATGQNIEWMLQNKMGKQEYPIKGIKVEFM